MSTFKEKVLAREQVLGTMVTTFIHPDTITMLKVCGFDYLIVDCEHGSIDYSQVALLLGHGKAIGIPTLVRIPEVRREIVLKYMEAGAAGLLLPSTDTAEQAKLLVEYAKYAPLGNRGVSLLRAHTGFEKIASATDYMAKANSESVLMIQVESPTSVENLDEILAVDGIDCAFVGPNDLSQSLGVMGQYQNTIFTQAIDKIIAVSQKHQKSCGIHLTGEPSELLHYRKLGMNMNLWANDAVLMMKAAREGLAVLK